MSKKPRKNTDSKIDLEIIVQPGLQSPMDKIMTDVRDFALSQNKVLITAMESFTQEATNPILETLRQTFVENNNEFVKRITPNSDAVTQAVIHSDWINLASDLTGMEKEIVVMLPEVKKEPLSERREKILVMLEEQGKTIALLQKEIFELKQNQEKKGGKKISKIGRQTPADNDKLEALRKWDELDKSVYSITLEQFLKQEFGQNPDGSPRVPNPTFHGWRRQLKNKGSYTTS